MSLNTTPGFGKSGISRIRVCQSGMGCSLFRDHDDASGHGAWPRAGAAALVASHALDQRQDVAFTYSDLPGTAAARASRSAASHASVDGTRTSGCTPVPSQLPPLNGLTGEPVGTNTASPSRVATGAPGLAAPPLASPTIVARPACCSV